MAYLLQFHKFFGIDSFFAFLLAVCLSIACTILQNKTTFLFKFLLFLSGVCTAYFACSLDPFVHDWDEQFHALVAKNMISDPLNPTLINNALLTNSNHWTASHIWLHKQPLFLWQMALSMKLFGVNELALRFPNILAHGCLVVMLFDIGKMVKNEKVGLISSVLFCFLRFPLSYSAGMEATDHNDYIFLFYVTCSFWALFKYIHSNKTQYLILLSIFSGCAVLVKWLTGFIAIGLWGSYSLFHDRKQIKTVLMVFGIALIICVPWQIYCYSKYSSAFLLEMSHNADHFSEVVEGHDGPWYYHFVQLKNLYANNILTYFILCISLVLFAINRTISSFHKKIVLSSMVVVYMFFSFTKTRMPAFCMIVIPFMLLCIATAIDQMLSYISNLRYKTAVSWIIVPQLIILFFSPSYFIKRHTLSYMPNEQDLAKNLSEKSKILELEQKYPGKKIVFINARESAVKIMFYTKCDAVNGAPGDNTLEQLKEQNYTIVDLENETLNAH